MSNTAKKTPAPWPSIQERAEKRFWNLRDRQIEYKALREEYGAKGYSAPHCIHGTSLWADYDNICGGCESGVFDEDTPADRLRGYARRLAEDDARREIAQAETVARIFNNYRDLAARHGIENLADVEEMIFHKFGM